MFQRLGFHLGGWIMRVPLSIEFVADWAIGRESLQGGSKPLSICLWRIYLVSDPSSLSLYFMPPVRQAAFLCHGLSATMFCLNISPWWPVKTPWTETSETIAQTISFPLLDSLCQVVCPVNGRLTNIDTLFKIVTICLCSLSSLSVPPIYTFEIFCSCSYVSYSTRM